MKVRALAININKRGSSLAIMKNSNSNWNKSSFIFVVACFVKLKARVPLSQHFSRFNHLTSQFNRVNLCLSILLNIRHGQYIWYCLVQFSTNQVPVF